MSFKKKKLPVSESKNIMKIFSYFLIFLWALVVFFVWVSALAFVSNIDISWLKTIEKFYFTKDQVKVEETENLTVDEIKKRNEDKINILVVGRWWGNHDAPELTDTIIVLSMDTEKNTVSMLSIPRDLYVEYGKNKAWKINRLYEDTYFDTKSVVLAMETLEDKVEEIINEEIDYFVNLDFKGFISLVDSVWGININIPETFIDYQYPDWYEWYETFILRKWEWTLDWETSLKYARSRHSTSDFDRSLRQQIIIWALKDKMISLDYLTSPTKISALYETFQQDIQTDIPLRKIIPLAVKIQDIKKENISSSNLNDSCFFWLDKCKKWWFLYYPRKDLFWWRSVLLPEWSNNFEVSDYDTIHKYVKYIFDKTDIMNEKIKINIFNATKQPGLAWDLWYELIKYGFNIPSIWWMWNTENKTWENSVILYNRLPKDNPTLMDLQERTWLELKEVPFTQISSDNDVRIEIILADDYTTENGWV